MEKVNDLFKAFRAGQLNQEDIFKALLHDIQHDPRFCQQAIALLDQVQRSVPIPVTEFIELRAKVDKAVALQASRQPAPVVDDPDATSIYQQPSAAGSPESNQAVEEEATWVTPAASPGSSRPDPTINRAQSTRPVAQDIDATIPPPAQSTDDQALAEPAHGRPEATVIMPVPARERAAHETNTAAAPPAKPAAPVVDEGATLIAPSVDSNVGATVVAPVKSSDDGATLIVPTQADAAALPTNQVKADVPTARPSQPDSTRSPQSSPARQPLSPLLIGGAVTGFMVIALAGWLLLSGDDTQQAEQTTHTNNVPQNAEARETSPEQAQSPDKPEESGAESTLPDPQTTVADNVYDTPSGTQVKEPPLQADISENADSETSDSTFQRDTMPDDKPVEKPADDHIATSAVNSPGDEAGATSLAPPIAGAADLPEPPTDSAQRMSWYFEQLTAATQAQRLLPADEPGTATYYLVKMLAQDPRHERVPEARATISRMHTELARQARLKGQWDRVQEHLDAAMEVNLPSSYRP